MAGGRLTTHVLDTARGKPAAGVRIALFRLGADGYRKIAETVTNADGRTDQPMLSGDAMAPGRYELVFQAGDYLRASGQAGAGELFLDEIANLSPEAQEKILRVVEYGSFDRVGGSRPVTVNVRIVGATNVDLPQRARAGAFKEDLLDRLSFEVLTVPPLRMREGDVQLLTRHFAARMAISMGFPESPEFSALAMAMLLAHDWPGNVRELKNVVDRAAILCPAENIDERFLILAHELGDRIPGQTRQTQAAEPGKPLREQLDRLERDILENALTRAKSVRQAARTLGLSHTAILNKIKKHGLRVSRPLRIE